jgi:hypothetical protein
VTFPLVQELAAEGVPVRLSCGVLGFSRQAFYKWQASPVCERDWEDAHLTNAIVDVHADGPEWLSLESPTSSAGPAIGSARACASALPPAAGLVDDHPQRPTPLGQAAGRGGR